MTTTLVTTAASVCASLRLLSEAHVAAIEAHPGTIPAVDEWTSEGAASFGQDLVEQLREGGRPVPEDLLGVFKFALLARCLQSLNRMPAGPATVVARRVASLLNDIGEHHPELLDPECDGAWAVYHEPRGIADSVAYGNKLTYFPRSTLELLMTSCISAPVDELHSGVAKRLGSPVGSPLRHLIDSGMSNRGDLRGMLWSMQLCERAGHPDFVTEHLLGGRHIIDLCAFAGDRAGSGETARAILSHFASRLRTLQGPLGDFLHGLRNSSPHEPFRALAKRLARGVLSSEDTTLPLEATLSDLAVIAGVSAAEASEFLVRGYVTALASLGNNAGSAWNSSHLLHSKRGELGPLAQAMAHAYAQGRLTPELVDTVRSALLDAPAKTNPEGLDIINAVLTRWDMQLRIEASATSETIPSSAPRPLRCSRAV